MPLQMTADLFYNPGGNTFVKNPDGSLSHTGFRLEDGSVPADGLGHLMVETSSTGNSKPVNIDNSANLGVDLKTASGSTINDLRRAFKLQEWLEKRSCRL